MKKMRFGKTKPAMKIAFLALIAAGLLSCGYSSASAAMSVGLGAGSGSCANKNTKDVTCPDGSTANWTNKGSVEKYFCGKTCPLAACWFCPSGEETMLA